MQSILEGKVPSLTRAEDVAAAFGPEFYIGPPRGDLPRAASGGPAPPFDTFSPDIDLPVRGWAKCSLFGHLEDERTFSDLPMPVGIRERDAEAFYAIATGPSMVPEGIGPGDYCLVSPNTPLAAGMRVWDEGPLGAGRASSGCWRRTGRATACAAGSRRMIGGAGRPTTTDG